MKIGLYTVMKAENLYDTVYWIKYHLTIGFDKITILSNNSSLNMYKVLNNFFSYEELCKIDLLIDNSPFDSSIFHRGKCFRHHISTDCDWTLYTDNDEYLYLGKDCYNVHEFLEREMLKNPNIKCLCFYWKFMSSPNDEYNNDCSEVMKFRHTLDVPINSIISSQHTFVKSFMKKDIIMAIHAIHLPECYLMYEDGHCDIIVSPEAMDINGNNVQLSYNDEHIVEPGEPCIYHYYYKDSEHISKKMKLYETFDNVEEIFRKENIELFNEMKKHYIIEDNTMVELFQKLEIFQ